jgi:GTP-binding protein
MRPVVAIVGRPNVGKSTLFNRIVGKRAAIVEDTPGVTRDRHYGDADWVGREFVLVDTGGFFTQTEEALLQAMRQQAELAVEEATVVVFVCDAAEGLNPADEEVAGALRRSGKPVLVAANKVDTQGHESSGAIHELHRLGFPVHPVSAEHGRGIGDLLDAVIGAFPPPEEEPAPDPSALRLAVVGRPNVGKSTFINRLLGEERFLVSDVPGTTRDALDARLRYREKTIVLTDTAGIRRKKSIEEKVETFSVMQALRAMDHCDVAVVMLDATRAGEMQDLRIAGLAEERGRALIVAVNKWDAVEKDSVSAERYREELQRRLHFIAYAPVVFISATEGTRVHKVLDLALEVYDEWQTRLPTPRVNELVDDAQQTHPAPLDRGLPVKFFYAAQVGVRPPTFKITCNRPKAVTPEYTRYLAGKLRKAFPLRVPLRLLFSEKPGRRRRGREKAT